MGKPILPDLKTFIQAGINPKTKLPLKLGEKDQMDSKLPVNARALFRILDEQRAINRYKWYNLPAGLSSQELERLIYFKYSLCFFYFKELKEFYFMPYALDGTIDFYGRYNTIHPVPMTSGAEKEENTKEYKQKAALLSDKKLNVIKDVIVDISEITEETLTGSAVILRDYTNQMGQNGLSRDVLNESLLNLEADCLSFMRTNLLVAAGTQGLRVPDADCASEVDAVSSQMYNAAKTGKPYIAITEAVEIQELQLNTTSKAEEFFLAMQSVDNILLTSYGIENSGVYEKKAHILESENAVNASNVSLSMQDGLTQRQNFCNIVNSLWNLGIWCEISEDISHGDINGDGVTYDESTDGESSGFSTEQQEQGGEE